MLGLVYRLYQVRCALRVTPRMPVQVETCMPEHQTTGGNGGEGGTTTSTTTTTGGGGGTTTTSGVSMAADSTATEINHPPGASRVFSILYRNEEVTLKDVILFRAHLLGKSSVCAFVD